MEGSKMKFPLTTIAICSVIAISSSAKAAAVIQVDEAAFVAGAGLITFSEKPLGTQNPVYAPLDYGGGAGSPTVTFGGFFTGQSLGGNACGGAASGCVIGTPTGPLSLAGNSPVTFISDDAATPRSPVLSGSPQFNGPIAILFSTPQTGVGLVGGFFDSQHSTAITAFDVNGNILGSLANDQTGEEFLGLVTSDHSAAIGGLLFSLVGAENAGFAVDDIRFGVGEQVVSPSVPEPSTWAMMILGFAGIGFMAYRQSRKDNGPALAAN
jgi:hypothetical protein